LLHFLRKLASRGHILCLQETHGLPFEVLTELGILLPGWQVLHSSRQDVHGLELGGLGGVAILICPKIVEFCDIKHTVLFPGRIHKVTFDFCCGQSVPPSQVAVSPDRCFEVFNAHNFGLRRIDIVEIAEEIDRMKLRDFAAPGRFVSFFPGDFNFPPNNELPVILGRPQLDLHSPRPNFLSYHSHKSLWEGMFDKFIEFAQPNPTHFNSQSFSLSKLDRILSTLPASLSTKLRLQADVFSAPESLHYRKISDHAPVLLCIGLRDPQKRFRCSLPKAWVSGPIFESRINFITDLVQPLSLLILEQLPNIKECIRQAAFFSPGFL